MNARIAVLLLLSLPTASPAATAEGSLSALLRRVEDYLRAPDVSRARRTVGVAAVRGGIPTEGGEDLDQRLLDRARSLRSAFLGPGASADDERRLRAVYRALAASQYVQSLSEPGLAETRDEASAALKSWAAESRQPPPPAAVTALFSGPPDAVNDKALVAAGWGGYARALAPASESAAAASPGWTTRPDAARLDESLAAVRASLAQKALDGPSRAKAHLLEGRILEALAAADLSGGPSTLSPMQAETPFEDSTPATPAPNVPFDPKSLYQKTARSVVLILCASPEGAGELGSGSVLDAERRLVLTNAHVVVRGATNAPWPVVRVYFKPERMSGDPRRDMRDPADARVLAWDPSLDLALLSVPRLPPGVGAIPLGDPRSAEIGERVAAIGHPEQGGLWTLTTGIISAKTADLGGVPGRSAFQTDAGINRGNSGGPLLDAAGRMIGVNTLMSRQAADGLAITAVNFSIRSDVVRRWLAGQNVQLSYAGNAAPPPASAAPPAESHASSAPAAPQQIGESKPYDRDALIAAEIARMERLGEEMHEEIQRKLGR